MREVWIHDLSCGEALDSHGSPLWTFCDWEISCRGLFVITASATLTSTNVQYQFFRKMTFFHLMYIVIFANFAEHSVGECQAFIYMILFNILIHRLLFNSLRFILSSSSLDRWENRPKDASAVSGRSMTWIESVWLWNLNYSPQCSAATLSQPLSVPTLVPISPWPCKEQDGPAHSWACLGTAGYKVIFPNDVFKIISHYWMSWGCMA